MVGLKALEAAHMHLSAGALVTIAIRHSTAFGFCRFDTWFAGSCVSKLTRKSSSVLQLRMGVASVGLNVQVRGTEDNASAGLRAVLLEQETNCEKPLLRAGFCQTISSVTSV